MDAIWLAAPSPAVKVWRDGARVRWQINAAATEWASGAGLTATDWQAGAEALLAATADATAGVHTVGTRGVAWTAVDLAPGWLCWLVPQPEIGASANDGDRPRDDRERPAMAIDFGEALELASISVWKIDLATRRIHYNAAGYRLTGLPYQPDGLSLDQVRALTHPDDVPAMVAAYDEAVARPGVVDVEGRYRNADGSYRHLLTRRVAQRNAGGEVVALMGVSIDQTAQIAERERSATLRQRIDIVAEAAGIGIWSFDVEASRLEWNSQMYRIHGLPEGQPLQLREWLTSRVHEHDRDAVRTVVLDLLRRPVASVAAEHRIVRPDGTVRWLESRAFREPVGGRPLLLGITLDVTERHATRAQLELQQKRLALATRAAGMGVWQRELNGSVVYFDEQMYRLRGLDPADPRPLDEVVEAGSGRDDRDAFLRAAQHHLSSGDVYLREFTVRWPDGSEHTLTSAGTAMRDEQGQPTGYTGVNWDSSQRRQAEQALRAKEVAENASRAKSEFLARMSHELRTPLNAVLGFAQLVELDAANPLPAVQRKRVDRIRSAAAHLLALIEDVLDLSSIEAGRLPVALEAVDLDEVLDDVLQWVGPLAAPRRVALHVPPTRTHLRADARRLRQVLVNLVSNAVKYNHPGGDVWVGCRAEARAGRAGCVLSVRDNGRGLEPKQLSHLFEPFNRLGAEREAIEGVGIGLVIVRHLVELMGGVIEVDSGPGAGSEFRVWLESAERPTPLPTPLSTLAAELVEPPAFAGPALAVLYIEDSPVNTLLVEELIAMRGHARLRSAPDGRSGVAAALEGDFDVVLVDMQLPDIDGTEVLRQLRAQAPRRRRVVIGLSANATPEDVQAALDAGFDDYWTKPIDFKRFLEGLALIEASRPPPDGGR